MKINLLTHNKHFGCGIDSSLSLNLELISELLRNRGIEINCIEFDDLLISGVIKDEYYWVASSKNETVRAYIDDLVLGLFYGPLQGNLIPNIDLVRAYENKGYQVILAKRLGLKMPNQLYLTDFNLEHVFLGQNQAVIKRIGGSGSKGVAKIKMKNDRNDIKKFLKYSNVYFSSIIEWCNFIKEKTRSFLNKKYAKDRLEQFRPTTRFVVQEFIADLTFDRKVLVFFDKVYVLRRNISKNDFRASGSGLFEFEDSVSEKLLDFCHDFREKLNAPYVSMDVISMENEFNVIEFQCMNFGPYTKLNSPFVHVKGNSNWLKKANSSSLEADYVESIVGFLKQQGR